MQCISSKSLQCFLQEQCILFSSDSMRYSPNSLQFLPLTFCNFFSWQKSIYFVAMQCIVLVNKLLSMFGGWGWAERLTPLTPGRSLLECWPWGLEGWESWGLEQKDWCMRIEMIIKQAGFFLNHWLTQGDQIFQK